MDSNQIPSLVFHDLQERVKSSPSPEEDLSHGVPRCCRPGWFHCLPGRPIVAGADPWESRNTDQKWRFLCEHHVRGYDKNLHSDGVYVCVCVCFRFRFLRVLPYESYSNNGWLNASQWLLTIIPSYQWYLTISTALLDVSNLSPHSCLHETTSTLEIRRSFGGLSWTPSKVDPALLGGPASPHSQARHSS